MLPGRSIITKDAETGHVHKNQGTSNKDVCSYYMKMTLYNDLIITVTSSAAFRKINNWWIEDAVIKALFLLCDKGFMIMVMEHRFIS